MNKQSQTPAKATEAEATESKAADLKVKNDPKGGAVQAAREAAHRVFGGG